MALNSSVWLREVGRLYLRYMAVGFASIPFALAYALATVAGWNQRILLPLLGLCGLMIATLVWKRMGDWQVRPRAAVAPFEADWAELMKVALASGAPLQYRPTLDDDILRAWQEVLAPTVVPSSARIEGLQQMMMGKIAPQKPTAEEARREVQKQTGSVSAFQLGGQPLSAGVHG
jgi:hypothetical protein